MSADTVRLPMGCPQCSGWLLAIVGPTKGGTPRSEWVCPYCHKSLMTDFGGPLVRMLKRETTGTDQHGG